MLICLAVHALEVTQSQSVQSEFDRMGRLMTIAINAKNVGGMARFFAPDCRFIDADGQVKTAAERLDVDKRWFRNGGRFNVKVEYHAVGSTATSARTSNTLQYSMANSWSKNPPTFEYRTKADGTWRREGSTWLLTAERTVGTEYKAHDGKWYPSGSYVPVVTVHSGGGVGAAPTAAFQKIVNAMTIAIDKREISGATRPLAPSYYMRDLNGNTRSREETVQSMKQFLANAESIDYRSNFMIESWTKDSARLSSITFTVEKSRSNGKIVKSETRQTTTSWWVMGRSGWQLDHAVQTSSAYRDAQGHWHYYRAKA